MGTRKATPSSSLRGRMTGCFLDSNAASKAVRSFWLLGLMNNTPWVLMLACATNISSGGVALVFISNILPGLMVKISAPHWFHLISYQTRISMASVAMGLACFLVGWGGLSRDELKEGGDGDDRNPENGGDRRLGLALELFGVAFMSFACSLGEASLLALAGKFDSMILPAIAPPDSYRVISEELTETDNFSQQNCAQEYRLDDSVDETESEDNAGKLMKQRTTPQRACITAFSSGTGLAGIIGFAYKALFSDLLGWGLSATVWSAMSFSLAYSVIYRKGLHGMDDSAQRLAQPEAGPSRVLESPLFVDKFGINDTSLTRSRHCYDGEESGSALEMANAESMRPITMQQLRTDSSVASFTAFERINLVLSFWRYTIPLFTVYAAEYMMQAGVWSAIGFPVTSATARAQFYHYSNWTYQAGVFISRSSGNMWTASIPILWLMPILQVVNLYFFWLDSLHHFWYNYFLMLPCFFAGLLGGSVYVQGFSRVNMDMPMELKEFAIASVGVADSLGILVADVISLFLQSCIYSQHGIKGAVVDCPVNM